MMELALKGRAIVVPPTAGPGTAATTGCATVAAVAARRAAVVAAAAAGVAVSEAGAGEASFSASRMRLRKLRALSLANGETPTFAPRATMLMLKLVVVELVAETTAGAAIARALPVLTFPAALKTCLNQELI